MPRPRRLVLKAAGLRADAYQAGALPLFTEQPLIDLIDRYTPMNALWSDFSGLSLIRQIGRCPDFDEQCRLKPKRCSAAACITPDGSSTCRSWRR